jgi:RNA polymerase sigma factor FliA
MTTARQHATQRLAELLVSYHESHDLDIRNEIVLSYMPLVNRIATKLHATLPVSVELDDLISTGTLGLVNAIDLFDPDRGVKFSTYAPLRIRGAMIDDLRKMDWVPRSVRKNASEVPVEVRSLILSDAYEDEFCMDVPTATVSPTARLDAIDFQRALLKGLSKRDTLVALMYYFSDLTLLQAANSLGLSESRVSQIKTDVLVPHIKRRLAELN